MADVPSHPSKQPLASFGFLAGPRIGEEMAVPATAVHIGSGPDNEVVLPDDSVSKRHALLEYGDGGWKLTDLESTNGTTVEGVKLAPRVPTPLAYGAAVRFGALRMQFREVESAHLDAPGSTAPPPREAREARAGAPPRQTGFRLPVWVVVLIVLLILVAILIYRWTITPGAVDPVPQTVSSILLLLEAPPA